MSLHASFPPYSIVKEWSSEFGAAFLLFLSPVWLLIKFVYIFCILFAVWAVKLSSERGQKTCPKKFSWAGILETWGVYSFFFMCCSFPTYKLNCAGGCVTEPPSFESKASIVHTVTVLVQKCCYIAATKNVKDGFSNLWLFLSDVCSIWFLCR